MAIKFLFRTLLNCLEACLGLEVPDRTSYIVLGFISVSYILFIVSKEPAFHYFAIMPVSLAL